MNGKEGIWSYTPTKERIAKVALKLFSRKGFKGTTIKDIAKEVGITEGAIYRHFASKENIIYFLITTVSRELEELIKEKVLIRGSLKEQVKSLIETLMRYAFEKPDSFRFLTVYHILRENGFEKRLPGGLILENFKRAYMRGELKVSPEVALSVAVGSVERAFILWEMGLVNLPEERFIEELQETVVSALC